MVEVEITFAYRSDEYIQNDDGFFIDFGDIKSVINDTFDHRFLMYSGDKYLETMKDFPGVVIVDYMPTAENMAVHMRGLIIDKLESVYKEYAVIVNVKLSETVSSKVIL